MLKFLGLFLIISFCTSILNNLYADDWYFDWKNGQKIRDLILERNVLKLELADLNPPPESLVRSGSLSEISVSKALYNIKREGLERALEINEENLLIENHRATKRFMKSLNSTSRYLKLIPLALIFKLLLPLQVYGLTEDVSTISSASKEYGNMISAHINEMVLEQRAKCNESLQSNSNMRWFMNKNK